MGDKNNAVEVVGTDVLAKSGHAILKSIYVTTSGDRTYTIRDGTSAAGTAIFTMTANVAGSMPYINHPFRDGLFIDNTGGTSGTLLVIFE